MSESQTELFSTVLIKDPTIADITDSLDYAVMSGGSNVTYQQYNANSTSASSIVFQIQLPSTSIVVDRHFLLSTDINFTANITNKITVVPVVGSYTFSYGSIPANIPVFNYGYTDSLQAFPLNKLFNVSQSTINNVSTSVNTQDVIDVLLRMTDSRELYQYNGMTASLPDQAYAYYTDAVGSNNNPMGSYLNASYDIDQVPRGSYPISLNPTNINFHNVSFSDGTSLSDKSLVSYSLTSTQEANHVYITAETWAIPIKVNVTEPLIGLSPFIFGNPTCNCGGLVGVNTVSFTFNIDSSCKRFWSTSNTWTSISLGLSNAPQPFTNTKMLLRFLSTQPSDMIKTRCVTPYIDYPRYVSLATSSPSIALGASSSITTQSIQLNQLPDYFIFYVRIPMTTQTPQNSASFFTINQISINLNNTSGLLASATAKDLWRMSKKNGSTQSWLEFSGQASINNNISTTFNGITYQPYGGRTIYTTGSILILSPAFNLSLPDYISSSNIGQFQINATLNVTNTNGPQGTSISPEIVLLTANSGLFITEEGSSQIATGILTKEMTINAKEDKSVEPYSQAMYSRMIGGSLHNSLLGALKKHHHMIKPVLHHIREASHRIRNLAPALSAIGNSGFGKKNVRDFM